MAHAVRSNCHVVVPYLRGKIKVKLKKKDSKDEKKQLEWGCSSVVAKATRNEEDDSSSPRASERASVVWRSLAALASTRLRMWPRFPSQTDQYGELGRSPRDRTPTKRRSSRKSKPIRPRCTAASSAHPLPCKTKRRRRRPDKLSARPHRTPIKSD